MNNRQTNSLYVCFGKKKKKKKKKLVGWLIFFGLNENLFQTK